MTRTVPSASPYADSIGFSAAVATESLVFTAGFTSASETGVVGVGDAYAQTVEALRKLLLALAEVGATAADVVQTRLYLTDAADWAAVGRAHGEVFDAVRPAATMVVVAALLDPAMLVEIEAVAVRPV